MGFVQGLSEFLPISSSAHLVFTSNFYKVLNNISLVRNSHEEVFLDIMLHLGTLIAVLFFFRKELSEIIRAFVKGTKNKEYRDYNFKLAIYIIIGTCVTTLLAVPLKVVAGGLVYKPEFVGGLLVITGFLLLFSEYYSKRLSEKKPVNLKSAIMIGIAQGLAILPGFSRSGLTISTGMLFGSDRETSARYSFLLSIPIILGASMLYPLCNIDYAELGGYNWQAIIIGTIVSGITGYLCIKYFLKFVSRFSLNIFGYYCVIIGIFTAVFFVIK